MSWHEPFRGVLIICKITLKKYTFLHVPDVIVLVDASFPQELLYLRVSVCHYAVKGHPALLQQCKASLQALLFHVVAAAYLVAL